MVRLLFLITAGLGVYAGAVHAAELTVPGDYPTVQGAIDAAEAGDTVVLAPGEYSEAFILKAGVSIAGAGKDAVVITCDGLVSPVVRAEAVDGLTVSGITFRHTPLPETIAEDIKHHPLALVSFSEITFSDCAFERGAGVGVDVLDAAELTLSNCTIQENPYYGLQVRDCADAILEQCVVSRNKQVGVAVIGAESDVTIGESSIGENGHHGVWVHDRAQANVKSSVLEKNAGSGVYVSGQSAKGTLIGNTYRENRYCGVYCVDGSSITLSKSTYGANGDIAWKEVQAIMASGDFTTLEAMAARFREAKPRDANGYWILNRYYAGLSSQCQGMNADEESKYLAAIDKWAAAYPDSITWRIVKADALRGFGWRERGGTYVHEIKPEKWKAFQNYLKQAQAVLDETARRGLKDPEYYDLKISQALEYEEIVYAPNGLMTMLSQKLLGPVTKAVEERFQEAIAYEPEYISYYTNRCRTMLPRWGGSTEGMVALAETAESSAPNLGLYARIAHLTADYEGDEGFRNSYSFDWEKIKASLDGFDATWTESKSGLSIRCRLTCAFLLRDEARDLFAKAGDVWDQTGWQRRSQFEAWKAWAVDGKPAPGSDRLVNATLRDIQSVQDELAAGADPKSVDRVGLTVLALAVEDNRSGIARVLIDAGADPNYNLPGSEPNLYRALKHETDHMLALLLEKGADPNVKSEEGWPVLSTAISNSMSSKAVLLLQHGADPNTKSAIGTPVLEIAIARKMMPVVDLLLEKGADPNASTPAGMTSLMRAAYDANTTVATKLLAHGADPNLEAKTGWMALMEPVRNNHPRVAAFLIQNGADVKHVNRQGWSAVHEAAGKSSTDVLAYFLEVDPSVMSMNAGDGRSVLQHAAAAGRLANVQLLVEHGADVNYRNAKNGYTALDYAKEIKHATIVEYLKSHGATES